MKAYVTGGSSGIGKALAKALVARGDDVWICGRDADKLERAVGEIRAEAVRDGQHIGGTVLDVSDRAAVEAAAPSILEGLGGLDVLVNNAGVACVAPATEASAEDYERMMATNYFGTVWTTRSFLEHFVSQGSGTILCVASTLGAMGLYGYTAYGGSKFAVMGFCDSLRQDLLKHGVRVSVVLPADVDTPQLRSNAPLKPDETKALAGTASLVSPEFIAEAVLNGLNHPRRYLIIPGSANKTILWLNRVTPRIVRGYINGKLRAYWRHP